MYWKSGIINTFKSSSRKTNSHINRKLSFTFSRNKDIKLINLSLHQLFSTQETEHTNQNVPLLTKF